ncbi:hypothetical protein [Sphingobium sp. KCTC 72723]|uniref:hypothetical protein n=1 Tax=Sphingobium sp. KCTC 72723 TaxID=2733867 RepID=UPI00165EA357|nr:hypothetical protein [Sphingobium sp. KCTC 72723]
MNLTALLGGTTVPVLLMLSPLAVLAAKDCTDGRPAAKAMQGKACKAPQLPLM